MSSIYDDNISIYLVFHTPEIATVAFYLHIEMTANATAILLACKWSCKSFWCFDLGTASRIHIDKLKISILCKLLDEKPIFLSCWEYFDGFQCAIKISLLEQLNMYFLEKAE